MIIAWMVKYSKKIWQCLSHHPTEYHSSSIRSPLGSPCLTTTATLKVTMTMTTKEATQAGAMMIPLVLTAKIKSKLISNKHKVSHSEKSPLFPPEIPPQQLIECSRSLTLYSPPSSRKIAAITRLCQLAKIRGAARQATVSRDWSTRSTHAAMPRASYI